MAARSHKTDALVYARHIYIARLRLVITAISLGHNKLVVSILVVFLTISFFPGSVSASIRCYPTGGLTVCHDQNDMSVFYNTPLQEVAYYVQTIRDSLNYWTIYHSNARNKSPGSFGDSIKVGSLQASYNYLMPPNKSYKIWGTQTDGSSILYSADGTNSYTSVSGGGNPIAVAGRYWAGDNYYYVFFLGVADDNMNRLAGENDYRHYLLEARTLDFVNFEIKADINGVEQWKQFNDSACQANPASCRPKMLKDINGNIIRSNQAKHPDLTFGLIGSISIINNTYYYFYTDYDTSSQNFYLYYRTATNITGNNYWSAPIRISNNIGGAAIVRVAKAKGLDKWAVFYNCWSSGRSDLCLQYTNNLNVIGSGGISDLVIDNFNAGNFYLGLQGVNQQGILTDKNGNLISPDNEDQTYARGGELRWSDFSSPGVYGGKVWRAGWGVTDPCAGITCNNPPSNYCSGSTTVTYSSSGTCSGGSCSYSSTSTACAASSGWVNTSSCAPACSGNTPITQKTQQYRSYTCSGAGSCSYSVTNNQAVTCTTGSACSTWSCNGATLCTGGYCTSGSCAAPGTCSTCQPTAPTCVSGSTLRTYSAGCGAGSCNSQASYTDTNCPYGCASGQCKSAGTIVVNENRVSSYTLSGPNIFSDSGSKTFSAIPGIYSISAGDIYGFSKSGSPTSGILASGGTLTFTITYTDLCSGVACNNPPVSYCGGSNKIAFNSPGVCSAGSCSYTNASTACTFGCSAGKCNNDPCTGVTCNNPPSPACSGTNKITFSSPGTCSAGVCSYSSSTTNCALNDRWYNKSMSYNSCSSGQACTAQDQEYRSNTCLNGACVYTAMQTRTLYSKCNSCQFGCSGGACNPDPCGGVSCQSASCNGDTRLYGGFCSAGTCGFVNSEDCNANNKWLNSSGTYPCCSGAQTALCQDQIFTDYTCASGACIAGSVTNRQTIKSNHASCVVKTDTCIGSTLRDYSAAACASGACADTYNDIACQFGCSNGKCNINPCSGITCNNPPMNYCNGNNLINYNSQGTCSSGVCSYGSTTLSCTYGCANAQCKPNPCVGVTCNSPPQAYCSGSNRISYNNTGTCSLGTCSYTTASAFCQYGCSGGICVNNPCDGVVCNVPPASYCSGSTKVYYYSAGACNSGACSYTQLSQSCQYGCTNGSCNVSVCAGVTCNSPPASACISNSTLRTYSSDGCSGGSCQYPATDTTCTFGCSSGQCINDPCDGVVCNNPPQPYCEGNNAVNFGSACSDGQCNYQKIVAICESACSDGQCILQNQTAPTCTDTDGTDYNAKGTVTFDNKIYTDFCGTGGLLNEFYCASNLAFSVEYNCPGVCSDGQCLQVQTAATCTDTDGGINYETKGTMTFGDKSYTDFCNTRGLLNELYCASGSGYSSTEYNCPGVCSDGKCIQEINNVSATPPSARVSHITAGGEATVTVEASDTDGIKTVEIFVDDVYVNKCLSGTCSYLLNALGTHSYYAVVTDSAGDATTTAKQTVTVVQPPPPPRAQPVSQATRIASLEERGNVSLALAGSKAVTGINNISVKALPDGTSYYEVLGEKKGNILWIIPLSITVRVQMDMNLKILNVNEPFWGALIMAP